MRRALVGLLAVAALAPALVMAAPRARAQTAGLYVELGRVASLDRTADGTLWGLANGKVVRSQDGASWTRVVDAPRVRQMLVDARGSRVLLWSGAGLERCALAGEERAAGPLERVLDAPEPARRVSGLEHGPASTLAWAASSEKPFALRECLAGEGVSTLLVLSLDEGASWSAPVRLEQAAVLAACALPEGAWMLSLAGGGVARLDGPATSEGRDASAARLAAPRVLVAPDCDGTRLRLAHHLWIAFADEEHGLRGGRAWTSERLVLASADGGASWSLADQREAAVLGAFRLPCGAFVELLQGPAPDPYRVRTRAGEPWRELRAFPDAIAFARLDAAGGLLLLRESGACGRLAPEPDGPDAPAQPVLRWSELGPPAGEAR